MNIVRFKQFSSISYLPIEGFLGRKERSEQQFYSDLFAVLQGPFFRLQNKFKPFRGPQHETLMAWEPPETASRKKCLGVRPKWGCFSQKLFFCFVVGLVFRTHNAPHRSDFVIHLVAQCSATPASVAATPPCSATPFQRQLDVRHSWPFKGDRCDRAF